MGETEAGDVEHKTHAGLCVPVMAECRFAFACGFLVLAGRARVPDIQPSR